jgi:hypothetical protein
VRFTGEVVDLHLSAQVSAARTTVEAMARGFSDKLVAWQGLVVAEMRRRERAWADERAALTGKCVELTDACAALTGKCATLLKKEAADMMMMQHKAVVENGLRSDVEALTAQLGTVRAMDEAGMIQTLKAEVAAKARMLEDMRLLMKKKEGAAVTTATANNKRQADAEARMSALNQSADMTRREVGAMRELIASMSKRMRERLRLVENDYAEKMRHVTMDRAALLDAFRVETTEMRHRLGGLEAFLANIRAIVPVGGRPDECSEANRVRIRQLIEEHDDKRSATAGDDDDPRPVDARLLLRREEDPPRAATNAGRRRGKPTDPPVVVVLPSSARCCHHHSYVFSASDDETAARIARRDNEVAECLRRNAEVAESSGEVVAKSLWDILGRNPEVMAIGKHNGITLYDLMKAGKEDLCRAVTLLTMILASTFEYCATLSKASERLTGLVRSAAMTHTVVVLKMLRSAPDDDEEAGKLFRALSAFLKAHKGVIDVHVAKRVNAMLDEDEGGGGVVYADVAAKDVSVMYY